jgi:MOSC domain-containing protein YiiM
VNGRILQLNVKPMTPGEFGLPKRPVPRLWVTPEGAVGDFNNYRTRKFPGDMNMALLLLTKEVLDALRAEGWPVSPGDLGENVTLDGVAEKSLAPGTKLKLGTVEVEVTEACDPCDELYSLPYVGKEKGPAFVKTMMGRRGWYAKVLREGEIEPGNSAELL